MKERNKKKRRDIGYLEEVLNCRNMTCAFCPSELSHILSNLWDVFRGSYWLNWTLSKHEIRNVYSLQVHSL